MELVLDRSLKAYTLLDTVHRRDVSYIRGVNRMEKKKKKPALLVFQTELYIQLLCHNLC